MVTHDRRTHFETCRVSGLYDKLAAAVNELDHDRQKALMEKIEVKDLAAELREAITASGLTHYRIAKDAGITADVLDRFMGGTDLRLATAAKVADVLKLKLVKSKAKVSNPKSKSFDADKRGDRLCDWLRNELDQWPQEHLHLALHWVKQIATKEFKA